MSNPVADFGPLLISTDIDDAAIATLQAWLPTYLGQIERERGLRVPRPRAASYFTALEEEPGEMLDRALPAIVVTTARTDSEPSIAGDGTYLADWRLTVSAIVRGPTADLTKRIASRLEGSIRRLLVSDNGHTLGGAVHALKWMSAFVGPVPNRQQKARYLAAGIGQYRVWTQDTVKEALGPTVPDEPTYDGLPVVTVVTTGLTADPFPQES